MSEDWKNDRAEAEMRKHEAEMMKKLNPKIKIVKKEWVITASTTGDNAEELMAEFEKNMFGPDSLINTVDGVAIYVTKEGEE
jgi:hypothetical protein